MYTFSNSYLIIINRISFLHTPWRHEDKSFSKEKYHEEEFLSSKVISGAARDALTFKTSGFLDKKMLF